MIILKKSIGGLRKVSPAILAVVFAALQVACGGSQKILSKHINEVKQIQIACVMWAQDFGNRKYPDNLQKLLDDGTLTADRKDLLKWKTAENEKGEPWLYYGKGLTTFDGDKILIASPKAISGSRIIGLANGSSALKVTEEEFQQRLAKQ